jgi:hypothetical protein
MDPRRKLWNQEQQNLRRLLSDPASFPQAIQLFLRQHAMLHSAEMSGSGLYSFDDEIWQGLSEPAARRIPPGAEHSIAWITWHLARIEDVTMNLLVAGEAVVFTAQLLQQGGWLEKLKVSARDTGNQMPPAEVAALSATIDLAALRLYRCAVGRQTREVVGYLQPIDLKRKVNPARLQQVLAVGAVRPTATDLIAYWGGLTIAGLLLMPPTRHNFVHLNEAQRLKQKIGGENPTDYRTR